MATQVTLRRDLNRGLTVEEIDGNIEALRDAVDAIVPGGPGVSTPDATVLVAGKLRLAGALGGSASAPTALGFADNAELIGAVNSAATSAAAAAASSKVATTLIGAANGVAPLGADSRIAATFLPSYVDDVLEFATLGEFPGTGESGKIYVATGTSLQYRWSGSAYVQIVSSPGSTDAVTEGAGNLYFTVARVRAAVLTGIDLVTSAAVTAADTVMGAIGKLHARLDALVTTVAGKGDALADVSLTAATALTRAAHGNRRINYSGPAANLTIANDATGLWTGSDCIEVAVADASAGLPTIITPDGKSLLCSKSYTTGASRKGANSWDVGNTNSAAAGAATAPTIVSRTIPNAAPTTIEDVFDMPMWQGTPPAPAAFTVLKNAVAWAVTSSAWSSSTKLIHTFGTAAASGDTVTEAYTENTTARIVSLAGNVPLASHAALAVTNSVASATIISTAFITPPASPVSLDSALAWVLKSSVGTPNQINGQKLGQTTFGLQLDFFNWTVVTPFGSALYHSYTGGDPALNGGASGSDNTLYYGQPTALPGPFGSSIRITAQDALQHVYRVVFLKRDAGSLATGVLSNGVAVPNATGASAGGDTVSCLEVTWKAAAAGQTLDVSVGPDVASTNANSFHGFQTAYQVS